MAADNVTANAGTGGSVFRTLSDGTNEWPVSALSYPTTISAGANVLQLVDPTHGLPVAGVGTFAVTQSGTWNITNVSGTISLPTGASTAAKQPALGTAGSASSDVLTVQGIASMTALKVDGSAVTQPVSGTFWQATQPVSGTVTANAGTGTFAVSGTVTANIGTSGSLALDATLAKLNIAQGTALGSNTGPMIQGSVTTAAPTYTTGQINPLSLTTTGLLRVDNSGVTQPISAASLPLPSGASTESTLSTLNGKVTACNTGAVVISSGTVTTVSTVTSLTQFNGNAIDTNSGTKSAGTLRVVLATDQPALTNKLLVTPDANSAINVAQVGGSNTATAASGVQKVGVVGNAGATVDSTIGAGTAPTNQVVVGSIFNSSSPAPTSGQAMAQQADQSGNLRVAPGIATATLSAWNSGTALNATQTIFTNSGASAVLVQLTQTTTLTAGAVTFEVSYDGSNWVTISSDCVIDPTSATQATIAVPYTVQASTNKAFLLLVKGAQALRAKLSTQITGTGTVTPNYALLPYSPIVELAQNQTINLAQLAGTTADTNSGNKSAGTLRVVLATDQPQLTNALKVDGSAVTQPVSSAPATSGGLSISRLLAAAGANQDATIAKGSAGQVFGWYITNTNAAARFVKLYNLASGATSASTPAMTILVPGNTAGAGTNIEFSNGIAFGTGISFRITTGVADNDANAVAANEVIVNILYK